MTAIFDSEGRYVKTEWQTGDTITSEKINKVETALETIDTTTNDRLTILENEAEKLYELYNIINIKHFGAKGDGVTDDTAIFKKAFRVAYDEGGVRIYLPPGEYLVNGYCDIYSNTYIEFDKGAVIKKDENVRTQYLFVCGRVETEGRTGYGGGAMNVTIKNGTFIGCLEKDMGISCTFNHMQNLIVENCTFKNAVSSGHVFDLAGCKDVYIRNCRFEGKKIMTNREFSEVIQIDNSTEESLSNNFSNYDYLPTINVYVENCSFTPTYGDSGEIIYECPTPIGSHNYFPGHYYKNINFNNNYIENHRYVSGTTAAGCVRFYSTQNLNITNNYFVTTKEEFTGYLIAIEAKVIDDTIQVCSNVNISNNTIEGYSYNGENPYAMIKIYGWEDTYTYDIIIENNRILNCHPGESQKTENICGDAISLNLTKNIRIINNYTDNVRRLVYGTNLDGVIIQENVMISNHRVPCSLLDSKNVLITTNFLNDCGGFIYLKNTDCFTIASNIVRNCEAYIIPDYPGLCSLNAVNRGVLHGNIMEIKPNESYTSDAIYGYSMYGSSTDCVFIGNINTGFGAYNGDSLYISSNSTNINHDTISSTVY